MSEIKVNSIKGVGASAAAITVNNTDGTCTANLTNRTNKNLVINGDMRIAQHGVSSTLEGYKTIDMFSTIRSGHDNAPTISQADIASGTTPYSLGFRKSFKVTNGNQTSGAQSNSTSMIAYRLESQDMATSGWNYTSSSSYITLSFWVKASVSQNYYFSVFTQDGTSHQYTMETGVLTADTWTKIIKTIPGNSNVQFDTDTSANAIARGFDIQWVMFRGTNTTGTRPLNVWAALDGTSRAPDNTTTWYTTDNATFELTGVQLEVSDHATDFEHRSFGQELALCQRYYQVLASTDEDVVGVGFGLSSSSMLIVVRDLLVEMRAVPTIDDNTSGSTRYRGNYNTDSNTGNALVLNSTISNNKSVQLQIDGFSSVNNGTGALLRKQGSSGLLGVTAEL